MELSLHSVDVVNRLIQSNAPDLPLEFMDLYVTNAMASVNAVKDNTFIQGRLVRASESLAQLFALALGIDHVAYKLHPIFLHTDYSSLLYLFCRLVRLLCAFVSNLVRKGMLNPNVLVEVEAFCIQHSRLNREAVALYRQLRAVHSSPQSPESAMNSS